MSCDTIKEVTAITLLTTVAIIMMMLMIIMIMMMIMITVLIIIIIIIIIIMIIMITTTIIIIIKPVNVNLTSKRLPSTLQKKKKLCNQENKNPIRMEREMMQM